MRHRWNWAYVHLYRMFILAHPVSHVQPHELTKNGPILKLNLSIILQIIGTYRWNLCSPALRLKSRKRGISCKPSEVAQRTVPHKAASYEDDWFRKGDAAFKGHCSQRILPFSPAAWALIFSKVSSLRSCSTLHASIIAVSWETPSWIKICVNSLCLL